MHQKALDEGVGVEFFDLRAITLLAVAESEAHAVALHIEQAMIGDGHPVGIAAEVIECALSRAKRRFGVDDPFFLADALEKTLERLWVLQVDGVGREAQSLFGVEPFEA